MGSVTFARHAESIGNPLTQDERARLEIPNHMYPLSELGRKQAHILGQYFADNGTKFDVCFHSTFLRTKETLGYVLSRSCAPFPLVIEDSRFNEKWGGIFHELTSAEIEQRYADQIRLRQRSDYYHFRPLGGENGPDVEMRIRSFRADLLSHFANKRVLIIGHGEWFLLYQKVHHNLTVQEYISLKERGCKNCSVTVYEENDFSIPKPVIPWEGLLKEQASSFA